MLKKTISTRTVAYNWKLGCYLAFIAGALNAGGFVAIGLYTSHMTGIASSIGDNIFVKSYDIASSAVFAIIAFMLGSITTTLLINVGKYLRLKSHYAFVLFLEGLLILTFGILATYISDEKLLIFYMLCFLMGLQNATMSKISNAQIRTTHITGMVTDISIELGKWLAKIILPERNYYSITVNKTSLRLHSRIMLSFIFGGICGVYGFGVYGYLYVIPLALILLIISLPALYFEVKLRLRLKKMKNAKLHFERIR
jgi:uncharacterized membrane protein YoaK (UPF0700 family)